MNQLSLIDKTPAERFKEFHDANPHVYKTLVFKCRQWRRRHPERKCGIRMLWESMRWDFALSTNPDEDEYKLNNNYTSHYARTIMDCEPDLNGIFEVRG